MPKIITVSKEIPYKRSFEVRINGELSPRLLTVALVPSKGWIMVEEGWQTLNYSKEELILCGGSRYIPRWDMRIKVKDEKVIVTFPGFKIKILNFG